MLFSLVDSMLGGRRIAVLGRMSKGYKRDRESCLQLHTVYTWIVHPEPSPLHLGGHLGLRQHPSLACVLWAWMDITMRAKRQPSRRSPTASGEAPVASSGVNTSVACYVPPSLERGGEGGQPRRWERWPRICRRGIASMADNLELI